MPGAKAEDVIAAILAGYEAMTRLGRAIDGPTAPLPRHLADLFRRAVRHRRGRRAAARARRAGRPPMRWRCALTLAAPGVGHHNAQTTARWFAVGNAARNGLSAALAAKSRLHLRPQADRGQFPVRRLRRRRPTRAALTARPRRGPRRGRGVVQAVVRGAPDHGGDPGAQGDHARAASRPRP